MNRFFSTILLSVCATTGVVAQTDYNNGYNQVDENGNFSQVNNNKKNRTDSLGSDKEIPKGLKVWTVDERFGDRTDAVVDTASYLYMNSSFTTGLRGEYNTTGNMGAPRIARIFIDRPEDQQFIFTQPYDYFVKPVNSFHFTNTYSPITNVTLNSCGDRTNGEDDFKAIFATNYGKKVGFGFRFDYKYGRGYYSNQSTSHFGYTMWGSYIGDRYQAHLLFSTNHQKVAENGGITDDNYITHPESFNESFQTSEIPTVLEQNWNRNDNNHIFFTHRYSLGFNRKVKMTDEEIKARRFALDSKKENDNIKAKQEAQKNAKDAGKKFDEKKFDKQQQSSGRPDNARIVGDEPSDTAKVGNRVAVNDNTKMDSIMANAGHPDKSNVDTSWMKNEYVPVTSFIHTLKIDSYDRIYEAYTTPTNYYADTFYDVGKFSGDSIYDETRHYDIKNTLAIALLEGFNKWAKAGLKVFASYDLRHFELPNKLGGIDNFNEHSFYAGGELSKTQGSLLHYNATAEIGVAGEDIGTFKLDGNADLNFHFLGDTVRLAANAFIHHNNPGFYFRHYQSRHLWWSWDPDKEIHSRIQGILSLDKTHTQLRIAFDEIKNYTYYKMEYNIDTDYNRTGMTVSPEQESSPITVITAELNQNLKLGPLHWDNTVTFQKTSNDNVLPVPTLNIYSNLYLQFKIAHVLETQLGADLRYFTSYYAPDYSAALGSYAVQGDGTNQRTKVGNYPLANVYINFHLKHTRFYVLYSHADSGSFNKQYFYTPHYPLNDSTLRFGISWNFFN